jgi:hypothetical protein
MNPVRTVLLALTAVLATALLASTAAAQSAQCTVGNGVEVLWNGSWYPATVEQTPNATGQCQIGYDGWSDTWDEWIPSDRMRPRSTGPCAVGKGIEVEWQGSWYPAVIEAGPNGSGQCQIGYVGYGDEWDEWVGAERMRAQPAPGALCAVGLTIEVLWNASWYPAVVEQGMNATGQCQIGYVGYGDEWDEWVGPERMRSPR